MVKVPKKWLQFTDHWLKGQWAPVTALFSLSRTLTQIPMEFSHLVRYDCGSLVKKTTDHQIYIFIICTSPSIPVFNSLFFLASCFKRTSCPFRRLSFHLAVNPLGLCLLSVLFFLHHQCHHSVPLHRCKESWVPEKSSNWNQHWMTASLSSLLSKLESLF